MYVLEDLTSSLQVVVKHPAAKKAKKTLDDNSAVVASGATGDGFVHKIRTISPLHRPTVKY